MRSCKHMQVRNRLVYNFSSWRAIKGAVHIKLLHSFVLWALYGIHNIRILICNRCMQYNTALSLWNMNLHHPFCPSSEYCCCLKRANSTQGINTSSLILELCLPVSGAFLPLFWTGQGVLHSCCCAACKLCYGRPIALRSLYDARSGLSISGTALNEALILSIARRVWEQCDLFSLPLKWVSASDSSVSHL